jgi:hypothetical protein
MRWRTFYRSVPVIQEGTRQPPRCETGKREKNARIAVWPTRDSSHRFRPCHKAAGRWFLPLSFSFTWAERRLKCKQSEEASCRIHSEQPNARNIRLAPQRLGAPRGLSQCTAPAPAHVLPAKAVRALSLMRHLKLLDVAPGGCSMVVLTILVYVAGDVGLGFERELVLPSNVSRRRMGRRH